MTNYPLATTTWDAQELEAIREVISTDRYTMGPKVAKFESEFAKKFDSKFAVMSNSGSSANLLALAAYFYAYPEKFAGRSEIIVPAVSWSTTYYPIHQLGLTLKFVDVDLDTLNIDVEGVISSINSKTAGIVVVNLLGNPAELKMLRQIADDRGIFLIEDNCESMSATLGGKQAGTFGEIGTFSTFFSHHISTMEGGMCVTDDEKLAHYMISLRAHGWTRELPSTNRVFSKVGDPWEDLFRFILPGYNMRPLEFSGAIGSVQLEKLDGFIQARRKNAAIFQEASASWQGIRTQRETGESSWFGFSMIFDKNLHKSRSEIVSILESHGIDSRPIVTGNFTRNPVMAHLRHADIPKLPHSDIVHEQGIFIGNHHYDLSREIETFSNIVESEILA